MKTKTTRRTGILFFTLCFFQAVSLNSFAQHTDTTAKKPDSVLYHLVIASTGSLNESNGTNSYLLNNSLRLNASHRLFTLNVNGSYLYGLNNNLLTNNDVNISSDANFFRPDSKFFYWVLVNYTSSVSLKINGLIQSGGGVAYNFIKTKENRLNLSDGILYEKDDLYRDTLHDVYNTFRNSFRLAFRWTIVKNLIFEGSNFFQHSFSYSSDYIIKSNLVLIVNLYKWLSLTSTFVFNRFNRTDQQNLLLTYGLRIEKDL